MNFFKNLIKNKSLYNKVNFIIFSSIFFYEGLKVVKIFSTKINNFEILNAISTIILLLFLIICFLKNKNNKTFPFVIVIGAIFVLILKITIKKTRPDFSTNTSFPSGHTFLVFSFLFFILEKTKNNFLRIIYIFLSVSVLILRVISMKHDIYDISFSFFYSILNFYSIKYLLLYYTLPSEKKV